MALNHSYILKKGDDVIRYKVLFPIKSSEQAESYRVKGGDGKQYFFKVFNLSRQSHSSFNNEGGLLEIDFLKKIKHPNIAVYNDSGEFIHAGKKYLYLCLEFIPGETLFELLNRKRIETLSEAKHIISSMLNGLKHLHNHPDRIIHNDITPHNIMLDMSYDTPRVKIIDFGHARSFLQSTKAYNKEGLNYSYVADECFNNIFSPQSDVFSVGAVLYQLIYGIPPWHVSTSRYVEERKNVEEILLQSRQKGLLFPNETMSLPDFDKSVIDIIKKALHQDTDVRFKDVDEFIMALNGEIQLHGTVTESKILSDDHKDSKLKAHRKRGRGFEAIAGLDDLKDEMKRSVIDVLLNPDKAAKYGAKLPNGMILYGPPGCGKTFFAKHFAEEVGYNFILATPSTLKSRYVNATQENIAEMFSEAEKNAPTIIFIDEINELLPNREGNSHEMSKSAVNEMLAQMDRTGEKGIFIIGATNFPDMIDPAMLRSGRLEKKFYLPPPDYNLRKSLFEMYLKQRKKVLDFGIDYEKLANMTDKYVSSDIESIVNDSALLAMSDDSKITMDSLMKLINSYKPLSQNELLKYEKIKAIMKGESIEEFNERPRIGFKT